MCAGCLECSSQDTAQRQLIRVGVNTPANVRPAGLGAPETCVAERHEAPSAWVAGGTLEVAGFVSRADPGKQDTDLSLLPPPCGQTCPFHRQTALEGLAALRGSLQKERLCA